jgi:hypothetical protein
VQQMGNHQPRNARADHRDPHRRSAPAETTKTNAGSRLDARVPTSGLLLTRTETFFMRLISPLDEHCTNIGQA